MAPTLYKLPATSPCKGFTLIEILVVIARPSLKLRPASKNKKGFTLIELLVVIAIIGLLSTLAVVALGTARQKSRDARRLSDLKQIQTALEMYNSETGSYPTTTSTILLGDAAHACLGSNGIKAAGACTNQYINFPKDPSGGNYVYYGTGNDYAASGALEGTVNNLSGAVSVSPYGGVSGGSIIYGLVGWWKFDEGGSGTTTYASAGSQNGSWNGPPSGSSGYYSPGKTGVWSGYFNGSSNWVDIPSVNPFRNYFTVTAWVNFNVVNKSLNEDNPIFGSGPGGVDMGLHLTERNGTPYFGFYADDLVGNTAFASGTWYQMAFVYDGGKKIYVNGNLDVSGSSNQYQATVFNTMIGRLPWAGAGMNGKIDDVRVYNRALTVTEIQSLYNSQK